MKCIHIKSVSLKNTVSEAMKITKFVRARPLSTHLPNCNEMRSRCKTFLLNTKELNYGGCLEERSLCDCIANGTSLCFIEQYFLHKRMTDKL